MRMVRLLMLAVVAVARTSALQAQSVEQILQKTRDTYVALQSYADTATVVLEYGQDPRPDTTRHSFTTSFRRSPRGLVLDFRKQGGDRFVLWGDPDAFHTWWKTTGAQYDFPNPDNLAAVTGSAPTTSGVTMKIPTLLYGKSALAALLLAFKDPELDGTEAINGHKCYRIVGRASDTYAATAKEVNVRRISVWIDAESSLVREVREEWKNLPGQVNRTTTIYEPQANPNVDPSRLKFTPPATR